MTFDTFNRIWINLSFTALIVLFLVTVGILIWSILI